MKRTAKKPIRDVVNLYHGLSPAARVGVWVLLALEVVLIAVAERDIQRRPAEEIRGPKPLWRLVATQNVIGPVAYLAIGRRDAR